MKNSLVKLLFFSTLSMGSLSLSFAMDDDNTTIICDDGTSLSLANNAKIPESLEQAKKDGPIVYVEDQRGRLYSLELNNKTNQLERTKIFRLPVVGCLYSWLWDNSNRIQLPKLNQEIFAKWAISYFIYPEGLNVRTISLFIMTQTNPIKIRNMDPWLLPWNVYEHSGPSGIVGVDIAAGNETVAIIGYQKNNQKVFAYRRLNYDLTGGNPMMHYRLQGGHIRKPSYLMQWIAKKIGVTQQVMDIPVPDWKIIPLDDDYQPKIRVSNHGQYIVVDKRDGTSSVYDCRIQHWLNDRAQDEKNDLPIEWPHYEDPKDVKSKPIPGYLNGQNGTFATSTQDPIIGTFTNEKGEEKVIYSLLPTFWSVFTNVKYLYDATYHRVQLKLLDK